MADLKISGSGRDLGGQYEHVVISGSGVIQGNVEADDIKMSGSATVNGNTVARTVKVSGSAQFNGDLKAERLSISGSCRIQGAVSGVSVSTSGSAHIEKGMTVEELNVSGSCKIHENLEAKKVCASGLLRVHGNVLSDSFEAHGAFRVNELDARFVSLKTGGRSFANHIHGQDISCRGPRHRILRTLWNAILTPLNFKPVHLEAKVIEGKTLHLEYTEADLVRGERVVIGKRSRIERVEYTEALEVEPGGFVKEKIQVK